MAAVTATILIGTSHPNDVSVDPHYLLRLWEGDRAAWTAYALADPVFERRLQPRAPEDIAADGAQLVMTLAREFALNAVMVCVTETSSLLAHVKQFASELTELDVHVLTSSGSRTYSQWSKTWTATGVLA